MALIFNLRVWILHKIIGRRTVVMNAHFSRRGLTSKYSPHEAILNHCSFQTDGMLHAIYLGVPVPQRDPYEWLDPFAGIE